MIWLFAYALSLFAGFGHPSAPGPALGRGFARSQTQPTCPTPPNGDEATPPPVPDGTPIHAPTPKPPSVPPLCA